MRKYTVCTLFDLRSVNLNILMITRTVLQTVQWTIAKQTVKPCHSFVTRIILTISVFKITIRILHFLQFLFHSSISITIPTPVSITGSCSIILALAKRDTQ